MKNKIISRAVAVAAASVLALSIAACSTGGSNGGSTGSETGDSGSAEVVAPIMVDFQDLDGQTFDLLVNQGINIMTGDVDPAGFAGESSDSAVAEFQEGGEKGTATFNPGVLAKKPGTATITVDGPADFPGRVSFSVIVSE